MYNFLYIFAHYDVTMIVSKDIKRANIGHLLTQSLCKVNANLLVAVKGDALKQRWAAGR